AHAQWSVPVTSSPPRRSSDLKWRHLKSVIVPSVQSPPSMLKLHDFCNRALRRDISREVASYPHSRCVQSSTARSDLALETAEDGARRLPRLRHRSIAQPSNCKGRPRHRWIDARGGSGQPSALTDAATETAGKPNDIDLTTIGQDRDRASARGALDRLGPN